MRISGRLRPSNGRSGRNSGVQGVPGSAGKPDCDALVAAVTVLVCDTLADSSNRAGRYVLFLRFVKQGQRLVERFLTVKSVSRSAPRPAGMRCWRQDPAVLRLLPGRYPVRDRFDHAGEDDAGSV